MGAEIVQGKAFGKYRWVRGHDQAVVLAAAWLLKKLKNSKQISKDFTISEENAGNLWEDKRRKR